MAKCGYVRQDQREMNQAMLLSVAVGFAMLLLKLSAYFITGSAAILSDSVESIVHVFAVGFAAYSMWLSHKPADQDHTYGHDRIAFFSAGLEGALISFAALCIAYQAIYKLIFGVQLERLEMGMMLILIATILNGFLAFFLRRLGKKHHSLVLVADAKHILTDCLTSFAILLTLLLTRATNWVILDPLIAIVVALNILFTGIKLIAKAVSGLMDRVDLQMAKKIRDLVDFETEALSVQYHRLRHRNCGNRILIEIHLLLPETLPLVQAHAIAIKLEKRIESSFAEPVEFIPHLAILGQKG